MRKTGWGRAAVCLAFLLPAAPASAYNVSVNFITENPLVFAIGPFLPGDLSNLQSIRLEDINPFFTVTFAGTGSNPAYLWLRMSVSGDRVVFESHTERPVNVPIGTYNNQQLAQMFAGNMSEVDANQILGFLDGPSLRQGQYYVTVAVTDSLGDWNWVQSHNQGIGTRGFYAFNPSQVSLEQPRDGATLTNNPVFIWTFPRQAGVSFLLELVKGEAGTSAAEAMESPNPSNVYAEVEIEVPEWMGAGNITTHIYTGIGEERALDAGTYFWRVTARASGVFPGDEREYASPIYTFTYNPPGGGGIGAGQGGTGGIPGGAGGGPEESGENVPAQVFQVLAQILPEALYQSLLQAFGDLTGWRIERIVIGDREVTLEEMVNFLLSGDRVVTLVAVQQ